MARRVLVVDDEPETLNLLRYSLEQDGFEVSTCDSGREALEQIAAARPDLLILDVMLPGVDGYAIASKLSGDPVLKGIPVIVLTALEPSKALFRDFPQVAAFLTKPFENEALLAAARKAVAVEAA